MPTPICSLTLRHDQLARVHAWLRAVARLVGMPALQGARWSTVLASAARAAAAAGGGTLSLAVDGGGTAADPRSLVAEVHLAGDEAEVTARRDAVLGTLVPLRSLLGAGLRLTPGPTGVPVLTLGADLADEDAAPADADLAAQAQALLEQPLPSPEVALAQHEADMRDVLAATEGELNALREAQAHALDRLAHDLRSPLLTLNLSLEMLRLKPHSPAELEERREVMKRQADQLKALAAGLRQPLPALAPLPESGAGAA